MNLYLEASSAVKQYMAETGTADVLALVQAATQVGTSGITRVEVVATLSRANRGGRIPQADADAARDDFHAD